jgi:hypothetical protein
MPKGVTHSSAVWLFVSGLLFVCFFCQAYPDMAEGHHPASPAADRSCATVGEVVPTSLVPLLVGSLQSHDESHDAAEALTAEPALAFVGALLDRRREVPLAVPHSTKLYQLNRTYRI